MYGPILVIIGARLMDWSEFDSPSIVVAGIASLNVRVIITGCKCPAHRVVVVVRRLDGAHVDVLAALPFGQSPQVRDLGPCMCT